MYSLIVFLPLIGALIAGFGGRFIGARAAQVVTCSFLVVCAVLAWVAFFQVALGHTTDKVHVLTWVHSGTLIADWAFRIDTLTAVMLVVVTTVSSVVHIYSIGYMAHDPHPTRFFAYLSLFTFAMLMLVTSDNLLQLFFGWEGVGLASYLLIGFWYHKDSANAAAIKAFVVNRVGDFGFALGIFAAFVAFGSIEFDTIFANAAGQAGKTLNFLGWNIDTLTLISLLLFMGAMGKSAQFLLHTWLPDAMEGPTPVSALIHAATMVTAGVFLVARMSPIFEHAPAALWFVTFIGATTCFFAATIGLVQNDIKRVIAYSTCSQLGYMFAALGVGAYGVGIFHLFTHAFFKALLFLGSGSVIHGMSDEQDMRKMGGLFPHMKITWAMMLIGTLALTGFPIITAGYYSKDAIIESTYAAHSGIGMYAFILTVLAAALTAFYSWRVMFLTFHGRSRAPKEVLHHVHESPNVMLIPLYVLAVGSIAAGFVFAPYFIGHDEAAFWGAALFRGPDNHIVEEMHHVPFWVVISPTVMMVLGFLVAFYFYIVNPEAPKRLAELHEPLYKFLLNKWYFDELYDFIFVRGALALGRIFWKRGDGQLIDGLGPDGISARVLDVTRGVVKLQSGYLYHYAFAMLIGIAALVTWLMYAGA
ncbi:NADH-quinone oxidoreductase subunit L [Rhodoligotrophos defluvii]|uniref:NADH-quinone oxidoreductase subunit L n=1 Tax=Rhodoligotrophos defluvii TaxID=2561934 RepID=UPI0010C9C63B|nr:NADH-quinone oxidoreductase subunit L [Rhodoligotrophos defluvii]